MLNDVILTKFQGLKTIEIYFLPIKQYKVDVSGQQVVFLQTMIMESRLLPTWFHHPLGSQVPLETTDR